MLDPTCPGFRKGRGLDGERRHLEISGKVTAGFWVYHQGWDFQAEKYQS